MPYCFGWFFPLLFFGFFIYIFFFRRGGPPFQSPWNNGEERQRHKDSENNPGENKDREVELLRRRVRELEDDLDNICRRLEEKEK